MDELQYSVKDVLGYEEIQEGEVVFDGLIFEELNEGIIDPVLRETERVYGIQYLYPWQRMVIENILDAEKYRERGNQIVLLPTGAGKSLCFMVPALFLPGPTLIIYPLLALMSDQERRLKEGGQDVVVLRGGQSEEERNAAFELVKNGAKFILANPEVLQSQSLLSRLKRSSISHIAIDEAHCVSEWGDTFRPAYLNLGNILKYLQVPVVTAFTATASSDVLKRVSDVLFDGTAHLVRSESDRPNIHYYVTWACAKKKALIELILREARPLIVFCSSRSRTRELAIILRDFLQGLGEYDTVRFYHAGLSRDEKTVTEQWFYPKADGILISTCAFGMGVDKKDIKTVIHFDPPTTVEAYIQEAGRGGRDGSVAKAILLWSPQDSERALCVKNPREKLLASFAESTSCRRQVLLDALGGETVVCSGCDICNGSAKNIPDDFIVLGKFLKKSKKLYTLSESYALAQEFQNQLVLQHVSVRIWEESDIKEVYDCFSSMNKKFKHQYFKVTQSMSKRLFNYLKKLVKYRMLRA